MWRIHVAAAPAVMAQAAGDAAPADRSDPWPPTRCSLCVLSIGMGQGCLSRSRRRTAVRARQHRTSHPPDWVAAAPPGPASCATGASVAIDIWAPPHRPTAGRVRISVARGGGRGRGSRRKAAWRRRRPSGREAGHGGGLVPAVAAMERTMGAAPRPRQRVAAAKLLVRRVGVDAAAAGVALTASPWVGGGAAKEWSTVTSRTRGWRATVLAAPTTPVCHACRLAGPRRPFRHDPRGSHATGRS